MDLFADDLAAFLDGLGIRQKIVLCGLSMGGYIVFAFYRKYAARLAGLILTATRAAADTPQARLARDQSAELARQQGVNAIVDAMLPKLLAPVTSQTRPELVEQARQIMAATSLEGCPGRPGRLEGATRTPPPPWPKSISLRCYYPARKTRSSRSRKPRRCRPPFTVQSWK